MTPPQGTVTFVFTDIVGSTRLWEKHPAAMGDAVRRHDDILRGIFTSAGGHIFKTVGDAFCVAFAESAAALTAAAQAQRALAAAPWGETGPLLVRIGVHTGSAEFRDSDYFGGTLNRAARIESAAHGGQVLVSGVTRALTLDTLPDGFQWRDLGEHRLKGLERPEHLFQLAGPGLTADFPPPRSLSVLPNNLPAQTTRFIGRTAELEAAARHLTGPTRLLTLTGTGGTGKTRLALETGTRLLDAFRDGVWLVELALLTDAARLPGTIIATLGLREEPDRPATDTLLDALRRQNLLLILDNCEHLPGGVAALGSRLLKACPDLRLLATSRSALGIAGEVTLPVPPLAIFDLHRHRHSGRGLAAELATSEAVILFTERARAVRPDFVVDESNASAVAEICSRLDGIPLALELAAARLRLLDPAQIAARLADRFRLLRTSDQQRLPHQQTLQALVDWSHDLLTDQEKILFRRLGVFTGGRSLEAIEAVCPCGSLDESDILDVLQGLVEKSLVAVETGESGEQRYTILESVWQYAREALRASGEEERLREAHARYFLTWAEDAEPHFQRADQARWLARFDDDLFNLDTAIRWFLSKGLATEGMRTLSAIGRPLEVRGYLTEGLALARDILALPGEPAPSLAAKTQMVAGRMAWALDRYDEARVHFLEAVRLADLAGDLARAAVGRGVLAFLDRGDGNLEEAEAGFTRCLDDGRRAGDHTAEAIGLAGLGRVAADRGDLGAGLALSEAGLAIHRTSGDRYILGLMLWGIARTCIRAGDTARAESALREWTSIARDLGNLWAMPYILQTLASAACAGGRFERAARLLGAAEARREHFGFRLSVAEQAEHDADLAKLQAALPPDRLESLRQEGRNLDPANLDLLN